MSCADCGQGRPVLDTPRSADHRGRGARPRRDPRLNRRIRLPGKSGLRIEPVAGGCRTLGRFSRARSSSKRTAGPRHQGISPDLFQAVSAYLSSGGEASLHLLDRRRQAGYAVAVIAPSPRRVTVITRTPSEITAKKDKTQLNRQDARRNQNN